MCIRDSAYLDKLMTQFESATVAATWLGLAAAVAALVCSGFEAGGWAGSVLGAALGTLGIAGWVLATRGYTAGTRQTLGAVRLLAMGREAPEPSEAMRAARR